MSPSELLAAARQWQQSGELARAETAYRQLLASEPGNAELWYLLGTVCQSQGKMGEAEAAFQRSAALKPGFAPAHNSLGIMLAQQGRSRDAEAAFAAAVRAQPDFAHAHNNLGNALKEQGRREEALTCYQQAVKLKNDFAEAYNNLGNLQRELDQLDEAEVNCRQALRLRPDMADAHNNLGAVYSAQRKWAEAAASFRQALALRPEHAEALGNLATAQREQGEIDESIANFRQALRLRPNFAEAHGALAMALSQQGDLQGALQSCQQALRLRPELPSAHLSMGFILSELGRREEALACCARALELEPDMPDAHKNRSLVWLLEGKLEQGWEEYEWRWKCPELPERPFRQPLWNGSPLDDRTIMLHAEQGFGDTLHFIRYASLVHDRGGRVVVVCQRPLVSLIARCRGLEQATAQDDPLPEFVTHAPLLGLPRIFGTTLENIPAEVPYLVPEPKATARWREELTAVKDLKVGIAWQGSRTHRRDRGRSIPLELFAPLTEIPGVQLYSLQKNDGREQLAQVHFRDRIVDLSPRLETFDDTAAVVENLDLVIACDTSVIHLAGGLGKPTWVAVTSVPDWRWLLDRDDSPWYPTVRLFRQRERGDWPEVFDRISAALAAKVGATVPEAMLESRGNVAFRSAKGSSCAERKTAITPPSSASTVPMKPIAEKTAVPSSQAVKTPSTNTPASFDEARRQHQAGNVEQAVSLYRQVLLAEPNNAQAWYLMGAAFVQLGKLNDARASLRQATSVNPWHAEAHNHLGVVLAQQAALDDAINSFRRSLEVKPENLEALNNLGLALLRQDKGAESIAIFQRALAIKPDDAKARHNLNRALREQGHFEELLTSQRQAVGQQPHSAQAHNDLGLTLYEQGRFDEAAAAFRQALEVKPDLAEAHNNLGLVRASQGNLDEAIADYRRAIVLKPSFAEAHNNLGIALRQSGQAEAAVASCRESARLKPELPEAHNNLGSALEEVGRYEEAIGVLKEALRIKPDFSKAHNNLGIAYWYLGRFDEAADSYRRAIELMPDMAEAHNNLGNVLRDQGHIADAEACYRQAADLKPNYADPHWNQSLAWLLQGDFERGWDEYEWRWKLKNFKPRACAQPIWDGSPLEGKTILLAAEQGLGDTVQFIRYAPLVKQLGARVLAEVQRPLKQILSTCPGIDQLLVQGEATPDFDTYVTLLSLPRLLRTRLETVPAQVPYLSADPKLVEAWRDEINALPGFKIGIAWKGSPQNRTDRGRSLPLKLFEVLARVPGVTLVSLQKGQGSEQIAEVADRFKVIDFGDRLDATAGPFMDTAAIMRHLGLVVTCDSSLSHLAGALGVRVWIALMLTPDWRWLSGRDDSPWYPTARLFRQTEVADWPGVFDRMAAALCESSGDAEKKAPVKDVPRNDLVPSVPESQVRGTELPGSPPDVATKRLDKVDGKTRGQPPAKTSDVSAAGGPRPSEHPATSSADLAGPSPTSGDSEKTTSSAVIDRELPPFRPKGNWADALKAVDPLEHLVQGNWVRGRKDLQATAETTPAIIEVPVEAEGSYDFQTQFTRLRGDGPLAIVFPVAAERGQVWFGSAGGQVLLALTGGADPEGSKAVTSFALSNNQRHSVELRVRVLEKDFAAIELSIDKQKLIDWRGSPSRLHLAPQPPIASGVRFALVCDVATSAIVQAIRVRAMSAETASESKLSLKPKGAVVKLRIAAAIDGRDRCRIDANQALWTHETWRWPATANFCGSEWSPKSQPSLPFDPRLSSALSKVDFRSAELEKISGRGEVRLERSDDSLVVIFDDAAAGFGADNYEAIITLIKDK